MFYRRSRVRLSALIALAVLMISACGQKAESTSTGSEEVPRVRVALSSWVGFAPLYVAQERGFYEQHGLDVELVPIEDPADRFNALKGKKVEAVATTVDTFAHAIPAGAPAKIVWFPDTANGGEGILTGHDVNSVKDLKGQTIAVNKGSTMEFLVAYVLDQAGLSMDDVKIRNMTSDQAGAAFAAGKVPAAATWEPWLTTALKKNKDGKLLLSTKGGEYAQIMSDAIGFDNEIIDSSPETVTKFLAAMKDANEFIDKNNQETFKIVADVNQISVEEAAGLWKSTKMLSLQDNKEYMGSDDKPGPLFGVYDAATKFWQERGKITDPTPAEDAIAPQFVRDMD
jgi:NitT/TauT family transport system substrate-binding protein